MQTQVRILLRASMEALFSLLAVANSSDVANRFLKADEIQRRKMFQKTRKWKSPELTKLAAEIATEQRLTEIEERSRLRKHKTYQQSSFQSKPVYTTGT